MPRRGEDSPQVHEAEPEEQHEGGQDEPAVDELGRQEVSSAPSPPEDQLQPHTG